MIIGTKLGLGNAIESIKGVTLDMYSIIDEDVIIKANRVIIDFKSVNTHGMLCLHTGKSALDILIKNVTDSLFTHVSCILNDGHNLFLTEAVPSKVKSYKKSGVDILPDDYSMNDLFKWIELERGNNDIKMIMIPKYKVQIPSVMDRYINITKDSPSYEKGKSSILKFLIPYSLRKLIPFKETKDSFFCSEYVLDILYGENCVSEFTNSDFSPGDFFRPSESKTRASNPNLYDNIIKEDFDIYLVNKKNETYIFYKVTNVEK